MDQVFLSAGEALKFFRERAKNLYNEILTQQELGRKLGVHRNTILNWENDDRPIPENVILKLEDILFLSENEVDQLLELTGRSPKYGKNLIPNFLKDMSAAGPGLVEAEHCHPLGKFGCTQGFWKPWEWTDEFSNDLCINNEVHPGVVAPWSKFYLAFRGIAVSIIYRQDTFYGSLTVEIDGRKEGLVINQRGPTRNQMMSEKFMADVMGRHYLVLCGSREMGIVTIDAIRIFGN
jgi:transcriptional regulator with XRE-family HTH domain